MYASNSISTHYFIGTLDNFSEAFSCQEAINLESRVVSNSKALRKPDMHDMYNDHTMIMTVLTAC